MRASTSLLIPLLVGVVAGCAGVRSIVPAQSTLADVRAKAGNPTDIRFDDNRDELWEYAWGPKGTQTYLVRAAPDGRVKSVTQLLTEEQFAKIVPRQMTKRDVRHLFGRPSDESFLYNGTSWSWRGDFSGQRGYFVVHFDRDDVVLDKIIIFDTFDGNDRSDRGSRGGRGGGRGGGGRG
ncbi:MAG TPA: hypothetical protein VD839_08020, partial [Burkholderiales bacterium]|nr:hypothetical protein [Burkholderiales bacterium]